MSLNTKDVNETLLENSPVNLEKRVFVFGAVKGGGGKSTTAIHAAGYFASKGYSVVILDADSSESANENKSCYVFFRDRNMYEGVSYIQVITVDGNMNIRNQISECKKKYDIVIIDTPGRAINNMAFRSASAIADKVVLMSEPSRMCYPSILSLKSTLNDIEQNIRVSTGNDDYFIDVMFLLNRVNQNTKTQDVLARPRKFFAKYLLDGMGMSTNYIKTSTPIQETAGDGLTIYDLPNKYKKEIGMFDIVMEEIIGKRNLKWPRESELDNYLTGLVNNEEIQE